MAAVAVIRAKRPLDTKEDSRRKCSRKDESSSMNSIDWDLVRENLPFGLRHSEQSQVQLERYQAMTNYLERIFVMIREGLMPEDVIAVVGCGSYFTGMQNPTLDITFRFWMRDRLQNEFWGLLKKLEEEFCSSETPIEGLQMMMQAESFGWGAYRLVDKTNQLSKFTFWVKHLFPTWDALKAARNVKNYWRRAVKDVILSYLGAVPVGLTIDVDNVSDALPRLPIMSPSVRIDGKLPWILLPENILPQAREALVLAESTLNRILFKQACMDHLLKELLAVSSSVQYAEIAKFIVWAENLCIKWLGTSGAGDNHIQTLTKADEPLPEAIRSLLRALLPGRAVKAAEPHLRCVRWRKKSDASPVVITPEDELLLEPIRERIKEAKAQFQLHVGKYSELSLQEIHRLTTIVTERTGRSDLQLQASAWVWACAQWTKRTHTATDPVIKRLVAQLKLASCFGITRITELKHGDEIRNGIEYVTPGTVDVKEAMINDRHVTAMVSIDTIVSTPSLTPGQIFGALVRYNMPSDMLFIQRYLHVPLEAIKHFRWNRRKWLFCAKNATGPIIKFRSLLAPSHSGVNLISALPRPLFNLLTYYL
ncbi:MAG: hypothetical protein Harvfovirus2_42 [Harvfovirus sp.]|uniref:Uncharacterized protein n=1 Tax=Harvfovirus sp. TaxID=2487768 RepID=A0A3G5A037_9VIRU|nr:MAG: hypothetical protein Harvfovirus2_42 [Harvfovirus sp.]